ncbi:MAG: hypothetical protein EOO87_00220 [Pedobacter sp.]|nr:MAG: hypothetical protein EOO87_00220 [Pedobacter sp.]
MKKVLILILAPLLGLSGTNLDKIVYKTINNKTIYNLPTERMYAVESGMAIDADGAPKAYHQNSTLALDYLENAGKPGKWWALEVDRKGQPLLQKESDPAPGFYISKTSLFYLNKPTTDPSRYINSETVPFIAIPSGFASDFQTGDLALVINKKNGKRSYAIVADIGPRDKIGEGSIFLAKTLGVPGTPKKGGAAGSILYIFIKNSGNELPLNNQEINKKGNELLPKELADQILGLFP